MTRQISTLAVAAALLLAAGRPSLAQVGKPVTIVDANAAAEAALAGLPNMNAARAKALVAKRPFASIGALNTFLMGQGLTKEQLAELYVRTFVPINLNTATDADILLIPGVGPRMLKEFKEYRPVQGARAVPPRDRQIRGRQGTGGQDFEQYKSSCRPTDPLYISTCTPSSTTRSAGRRKNAVARTALRAINDEQLLAPDRHARAVR